MSAFIFWAGVLLLALCVAAVVIGVRRFLDALFAADNDLLQRLHYWLAFEAPRPLNKLAPLVDRLMAFCER